LKRCLQGIAASTRRAEIIVVADGAVDDPRELAGRFGAIVLAIEGPRGPAVARNRGAAVASGDVLVFIDSDVVVHPDAIERIGARLRDQPDVAALFGAYDEAPADEGLVSQCKNLAHAYVHRQSRPQATTFWAGLGAVRAAAFRRVGGFDERFGRPSVEDIDLGYRLTSGGHAIRLDPGIQGTHLKRWTWWSAIKSDVLDRGIPWTQLLHRYSALRSDLNVTRAYRVCVVLAYVGMAALVSSLWRPRLLALAAIAFCGIAWIDRGYYLFLARRLGAVAAARWFPLHVAHHLCNGVSFLAGSTLHALAPSPVALRLGALPHGAWPPEAASDVSTPALVDRHLAGGSGGHAGMSS
jgi:glycosyltransferase involved in cell wall biosynthesis